LVSAVDRIGLCVFVSTKYWLDGKARLFCPCRILDGSVLQKTAEINGDGVSVYYLFGGVEYAQGQVVSF